MNYAKFIKINFILILFLVSCSITSLLALSPDNISYVDMTSDQSVTLISNPDILNQTNNQMSIDGQQPLASTIKSTPINLLNTTNFTSTWDTTKVNLGSTNNQQISYF